MNIDRLNKLSSNFNFLRGRRRRGRAIKAPSREGARRGESSRRLMQRFAGPPDPRGHASLRRSPLPGRVEGGADPRARLEHLERRRGEERDLAGPEAREAGTGRRGDPRQRRRRRGDGRDLRQRRGDRPGVGLPLPPKGDQRLDPQPLAGEARPLGLQAVPLRRGAHRGPRRPPDRGLLGLDPLRRRRLDRSALARRQDGGRPDRPERAEPRGRGPHHPRRSRRRRPDSRNR